MTTFKYKARTPDGALVSGVVEAYSEFEAVEQIKQTCTIVEKITPVKTGIKQNIDLAEPLWVEDRTLAMTASQFAIMLRSGISIGRVVELIADQATDRLMKRILTACSQDVNAGYSLAHSLERNGKKIPATFIETVRAGEESGTLDTCFERLRQYYDKSHKVKRKVRSALIYPIFLIVLAILVVAIIVIVLVPQMYQMFDNMNAELPLPTRILIGLSDFAGTFWPLMLIAIGVLTVGYMVYKKTPDGELTISKLKLKIPVFGRISTMNAASQFANTFATLMSAGLPAARVLTITSRVLDNRTIGSALEKSVVDLEAGMSFGDVLRKNPYLPPMLTEMAAVGEQAGSLEDTMSTIGEYYDAEAVAASDRVLGMLEPIITLVMGLFVGFIVIAIYVPMFSMYSGIVA